MEPDGKAEKGWQPGKGMVALLIVALVFATLLIFWRAWDLSADRQLKTEIDAAHARGEKIVVEDFLDPPPVPDEQNAAFFWKRAAAAADLDEKLNDRERELAFLGQLPASPEELAWLREAIANRDSVRNDVAAARDCAAVNWGIPATAMITVQNVPALNQVRGLANLLRYRALVAHTDGDDAAALDDVRAILREAGDIEQMPPSLVTHLVATGINAIAVATIEQIAPDLNGRSTTKPASGDQIQQLIGELLDASAADHGWHEAMQAERAMAVRFTTILTNKPVVGTVQKIGLARALKWEPAVERAGIQGDYPAAKAILAANPPPPQNLYKYIPSLPGMMQASLARVVDVRFRIACERRMAAIALAMALYRADHEGRSPGSLDALVPAYLPSLPPDPFAPGGKPFGYSGPAATQPFIYSIGLDGVDDGGSRQYVADNRGALGKVRAVDDQDRPFERWQRDDALFYLVHLPRPAPATQPSE